MPRKLGELGCTGDEARERLKRLFQMGLKSISTDLNIPLSNKERDFLKDMKEALTNNPSFEPSYGQVTFATDIFERYCI